MKRELTGINGNFCPSGDLAFSKREYPEALIQTARVKGRQQWQINSIQFK